MRTFIIRAISGARRNLAPVIVIAALVVATAIAVPLTVSVTSQASSSSSHAKPKPVVMGAHPTAKYKAAAAKLPAGLTAALKRDVHLTGAEYLANSAASAQASKVLAGLKADGVDVLGSRMDGTRLTVYVASSNDVAAVVAAGATAVVGAPKTKDYSKTSFHSVSTTNTYGGEAYFFQNSSQVGGSSGFRCSIGFNGYSVATGASQFATAGHCETIMSGNAHFTACTKPAVTGGNACPNTLSAASVLGGGVAGQYGSGSDYGIVSSAGASYTPQNAVATWNNGTGAPESGTPVAITGQQAANVNDTLCKSGSTSGWTCGTVLAVDQSVDVSGQSVNSIVATTCLLEGDSGGGAVEANNAVGIDSGSDFPATQTSSSCNNSSTCATLSNGTTDYCQSVFFPMVSAAGSKSVSGQQGSKWELGVTVTASTPTVTSPSSGGTVYPGSYMSGTADYVSGAGNDVSLFLDGSKTRTAKVKVSSNGTFRIPLASVPAGSHTYSLVPGLGWSLATNSATGTFTRSTACPPPSTTSITTYGGIGDFNCDGNSDVVIRDGNGVLWLYPGNGSSGFGTRVQLATGWAGMTAIVAAGDLSGDGKPDIVARDHSGTLWLYPGNGSNGFGTRIKLGATGDWLSMTSIQGAGDFDGDGHVDLIARDTTGKLWLYPGTGTGSLGARVQLASGWQSYTAVMGVGDFSGDGNADILARDASGNLLMYKGNGHGALGSATQIGAGWQGITIAAIGDFNNDGFVDIFVRDGNGTLFLYPGNGNGSGGLSTRIQVGSGWQGLTIAGDSASIAAIAPPVPLAVSGGVGDFNSDGNSDVVVRDGNGTLFLYPGNGGTGFLPRIQLSTAGAWAGMTAIVAAGDLNGDGNTDIIGRDHGGTLWLYPGNGSNAFGTREQLGATGAFMGMTAIQGVGDFNGDGHADIVTRDTSGKVLLYPGNGTSSNTLGAPITIASGWGSYTGIMGIGDFDGDGKSDILARDGAGALWLYPGLGSATTALGSGGSGGGFGTRIQVGGGWQGITIQAIGDFNNDGHEDIFVRDANGALFLYPGTGNASSPFLARIQVGGGWEGLTIAGDAASIPAIAPPVPAAVSGGIGDFNSDGNSDVVVRDGNGTLFLYPGNGGTGFLARQQLSPMAGDWATMTAIVAGGDLNGDGNPDIVGRDKNGTLFLYPGNGDHAYGARMQLLGTNDFAQMTAIQGVGDFNGDGHADLIARDATGNILLYAGNGTSSNTLAAPITIAKGWGSYTGIMGIGDFDGDGKSDVLARDSAGALWLYPGLGTATAPVGSVGSGGGFGTRIQVGGGWQGITIQAIGDFNNDGHEDIFVRDANGALFLYPGTGDASNPFLARIQVGGGWQGLTIAGDAASLAPVTN